MHHLRSYRRRVEAKAIGKASLWQPLNAEKREIRILHLHRPKNDRDPVCADLVAISLLHEPDYVALSYCWGDATETVDVYISGYRVPVTRNLFDALNLLRHDESTRMIWADAVCIDQINNTERASQVANMGDVFARAREVHVWLGKDKRMVEAVAEIESTAARGLHACVNELPTHMYDCFCSGWWTRVWTVQEAILAKILVFHAGPHVVDVKAFGRSSD